MTILTHVLLLSVTLSSLIECRFFHSRENEQSLKTLYAHDRLSDMATDACLKEMFPRRQYNKEPNVDPNDIPCIIHCVFNKFGIMTKKGDIDLTKYYKIVNIIHRNDPRIIITDIADSCANNINRMGLGHDHCKKAKAFNDCTQLYAVTMG